MQLDVTMTPSELDRLDRRSHTVAIIDVVRASTTMIEGLSNGCLDFVPVPSVAAARRTAHALGHHEVLLGGERRGVAVTGFHLGNSPLEYTAERVAGKTIVFTTTNGTAALAAAAEAKAVIIAALVNLEAAAQHLAAVGTDITLAAAGRQGRPALDDTVCAGLLAQRIVDLAPGVFSFTDGAAVAVAASMGYRNRTEPLLEEAAAGRAVRALGLGHDIAFCARLDSHHLVPYVLEGRVVRSAPL